MCVHGEREMCIWKGLSVCAWGEGGCAYGRVECVYMHGKREGVYIEGGKWRAWGEGDVYLEEVECACMVASSQAPPNFPLLTVR